MNALSWLLYFGDVAGNAGFVLGGIVAGCAITAVVMVIWGAATRDFAKFERDPEATAAAGKGMQKTGGKIAIAAAVIALVATFLPSRNTIMLIAASQVGETVLASNDVQAIGGEAGALATDSLKLLRKYVTEQLGEGEK